MPATEQQIEDLVRTFYARARRHPDLSRVFSEVHDWEAHFQVVADFWSHALLGTTRYARSPFPIHLQLPIEPQHFEQWLTLFRQAASETLPADSTALALARAEHMTQSFKVGLFPFGTSRPVSAEQGKGLGKPV